MRRTLGRLRLVGIGRNAQRTLTSADKPALHHCRALPLRRPSILASDVALFHLRRLERLCEKDARRPVGRKRVQTIAQFPPVGKTVAVRVYAWNGWIGSRPPFIEIGKDKTVTDELFIDDAQLNAGDKLEIIFMVGDNDTYAELGEIKFSMELEAIN